jgi:hypothetical protein
VVLLGDGGTFKMWGLARHPWFIPVILATQEAETSRIEIRRFETSPGK